MRDHQSEKFGVHVWKFLQTTIEDKPGIPTYEFEIQKNHPRVTGCKMRKTFRTRPDMGQNSREIVVYVATVGGKQYRRNSASKQPFLSVILQRREQN